MLDEKVVNNKYIQIRRYVLLLCLIGLLVCLIKFMMTEMVLVDDERKMMLVDDERKMV
jgi:hypothetical protein